MKKNMKRGASGLLCALLVIFMAAGLVPNYAGAVYAADEAYDDEQSNQQLYDKWTNQNEPDDFLPMKASPDPYGYGVDVPFYINKQSELVVYGTAALTGKNKKIQQTIDTYNLDKNNEGNVLAGADPGGSYNIPMAGGEQKKPLNYVKMVAFDPTNSGRDDHLAVIGVHNKVPGEEKEDKTLSLIVYSKTGKVSEYLDLGHMQWMGTHWKDYDNDNAWYYNAMNFLDITAGDYNGDGKDTLVIWGCFDKLDYGLQEIKVESGSSIELTSMGTVSKTMLHDEYKNNSTLPAAEEWVDNKLCAKLDTGDVNGDNIDDLVVISYVGILTDSYNGRKQQTQMYRPYITVSYGADKASDMINKVNVGIPVMNPTSDGFVSSFANGLSVGDINGDGCDEIVTAGIKNTVKGKLLEPVSSAYDQDTGQTVIAAYRCSGSEYDTLFIEEHNANTWTEDGLYVARDGNKYKTHAQVPQQYSVQCVAINGVGNPSMVFINADLYSFNSEGSKKLKCVHTPRYFTLEDDQFLKDKGEITDMFFVSACAGNFDGNQCGREQVVFTFGLKVAEYERYHIAAGMIGGDFTKDTTEAGLATKYYSTAQAMYDENRNRSVFWPEGDSEDELMAHVRSNQGLNYSVCAMDNDDDGILVRYHKKGYAYTDPEILAVLQAAPRYDELGDYDAGGNETSYSFTHSTSYEDTDTDSVSFGAGVTHGLEGTLGGYDLKAGYAMDWSHEFTDTFTEEVTHTFTAKDEDAVVMYRTPVTMYCYQIKRSDGSWPTGDETDEKNNDLVLSFPGTPAYSIISVDRYNEFAEYYNKTNKDRMKAAGLDESLAPKLALLKDADSKKYYLNTEGDPTKYINKRSIPSGVKILQTKANAFEASTGSTAFDYSKQHEQSDSDSMSHGFTFELTITFGLGIPGFVNSTVGGYVSLEYMHGHTHTTTNAKGTGVSCLVNNATLSRMKAAGYSDAACDSYGFNYQMAEWNSPIMMEIPVKENLITGESETELRPVPIFGYVLSDVKKPTFAALRAPEMLTLSEGYSATTSGAFRVYGDPSPVITMLSPDEKITYNAVTRKIEVAPGLAKGTYAVELTASNGIPGREASCEYQIKVQEPDYSESGLIASVKNMIANLPDPIDLLLSDEIYVTQARAAYEALTDSQKAQIPESLTDKLSSAEAQIGEFKAAVAEAEASISEKLAGLNASIDEVVGAMAGGSVPSSSAIAALESGFFEIEETYNSLSNEQKAIVSAQCVANIAAATASVGDVVNTYNQMTLAGGELDTQNENDNKAAQNVKNLINAIGDLKAIDPATTDETAFQTAYQAACQAAEKARAAYEKLTVRQKALVDNASVLNDAEISLGQLITERRKNEVAQQEEAEYLGFADAYNAIPDNLTLAHKDLVNAARFAYESLSPNNKANVPPEIVANLEKAEAIMAELEAEAEYNKKVKAATALKVSGLKVKALKGRKATVTWKANKKGSGYQIVYSLKKTFKSKKTVKITKASTKKATLKKLKAGKYYWVKMRTFTKIKNPATGKTVTKYGKWTTARKFKAKK